MKLVGLYRRSKANKRNNRLVSKFFSYFEGDSIIRRMIPIFFFIWLISHIVACVWHFIAYFEDDGNTWISKMGFRDESPVDRYVISLYFVSQTITTVGYGDFPIYTKREFLVAIPLMFLGVIIYGRILQVLMQYLDNAILIKDKLNHKLTLLKEVTEFIDVPNHVERELVREIHYNIEQSSDAIKKKKLKGIQKDITFYGVNKKDVHDLLF